MEGTVGKPERATQQRVIELFRDRLGYTYLGDWSERANSNIEEGRLAAWLQGRGHSGPEITAALQRLRTEANHHGRSLYDSNHAVYRLLRYGVPVKVEAGKVTETIPLIEWDPARVEENDFVIAEEVTLKGGHERRPDLVLYVNGIAVGVIELKNSRVSLGDGIRQSLSNQQPEFNAAFFSTVQFVFAGNDSEGLRYGTVGTPEKMFLAWKEDEQDNAGYKLDKYLLKICRKDRLIELMHDFVLFDGGIKKLPRVHQYFGIKAAQEHVRRRQGGILWHTQGSGKSITMVLLAKWILENNPQARVVVITDRDELDKQIKQVFEAAGETIHRTTSGRNLMQQLAQATPRLLCSLVHKFGLDAKGRDSKAFEAFIRELESQPSPAAGEIFVFVDECHRTQSGRLHRVMKALLPNAVFIGFTGTPLLKKDRETSLEVFGGYIHTYKFSEAVEDEVVLDLVYEARDIDQRLTSQEAVDEWFALVSKGLNDWQKAELRQQWGTMQRVLSSESRLRKVIQDIILDFKKRPRLSSGRGNAILVASSIYEACRYYSLLQASPFKGRCAVVTSYDPQARHVTLDETGANTETDQQFIYNTYTELLKDIEPRPGMSRTETYEEQAKARFIKQPANMQLLVVVDKLLTGFDAPPCTFLYIDKSMQDHGLFQAICRTNRLDGEDKEFGYIVDYKDLFKKVENAIAVYSSELDHSAGGADPEVMLHDRLQKGRERLDDALEQLHMLCEGVSEPGGELQHIHYFCGNTEISTDLREREPRRAALYKGVAALTRAYANLADDLTAAGYTAEESARIGKLVKHYADVRETVRLASGEALDLKPYEADMRHLLDTYVQAEQPRTISPFDGIGLLDLIVKTGIAEAIHDRLGSMKGNHEAVAEMIENNVRSHIIKVEASDPAFYERMSALLDEVIRLRREKAIAYEEYLKKIADIAKQVRAGISIDGIAELDTPGKRALYNNIAAEEASGAKQAEPSATYGDPKMSLALQLDTAIREVRPAGWRGSIPKENIIKQAMYQLLGNEAEVERLFTIVKQQLEY